MTISPTELPPLVVDAGFAAQRWAGPAGFATVVHPPEQGFYLRAGADGLVLHHADAPARDRGLRIDLLDGSVERRAAGGRQSPLARALGLRRHPRPRVLDTTCGLGRDSATLAALGCTVVSIERHAVLFALLDDARARAQATPPPWLAAWPELIHADAGRWLADTCADDFDIVYIDPMFDAPRRKARPQKALAWMHELVGTDTDVALLLERARAAAMRQVVVKQHARATPIAPPDRQVEGKAIRFDIYLS